MNMKSLIEGQRSLAFWVSQQIDVSLNHSDPKIKDNAHQLVSMMTPLIKSFFTDMGMEITNDAIQVFGGYGYTKDQGIEQLFRDNRITPIYEGTNSVQAIDLVFRKLVNKDKDIIGRYFQLIKEEIEKNKNQEKIKPLALKLDEYLKITMNFTNWIKDKMKNSKDDVSAACNDYLRVLGLIALAYSWLKVLDVSYKELNNNKKFFEDKIETANFYFNRVLPRVESHYLSATTGSNYIMDFKFN